MTLFQKKVTFWDCGDSVNLDRGWEVCVWGGVGTIQPSSEPTATLPSQVCPKRTTEIPLVPYRESREQVATFDNFLLQVHSKVAVNFKEINYSPTSHSYFCSQQLQAHPGVSLTNTRAASRDRNQLIPCSGSILGSMPLESRLTWCPQGSVSSCLWSRVIPPSSFPAAGISSFEGDWQQGCALPSGG